MGLEATCRAEVDGAEAEGKALLETTELVFRGPPRSVVKLAEVTACAARGGWLEVRTARASLRLELGEAAAGKWLAKIASPKSVLDKLGVKAGAKVLAIGVPDDTFLADLAARAHDTAIGVERRDNDLVFFGLARAADLARVAEARTWIRRDGAVWLLRPKGSKEITERAVREAAIGAGLVDVKVVSLSAALTAEKFVIPVKNRK